MKIFQFEKVIKACCDGVCLWIRKLFVKVHAYRLNLEVETYVHDVHVQGKFQFFVLFSFKFTFKSDKNVHDLLFVLSLKSLDAKH